MHSCYKPPLFVVSKYQDQDFFKLRIDGYAENFPKLAKYRDSERSWVSRAASERN